MTHAVINYRIITPDLVFSTPHHSPLLESGTDRVLTVFQNGLFLVRSEMRQVTETLSDSMVLPITRPRCLFLYNPVVNKLYYYSTETLFLLFSFLGTLPIPYPLPLLKRLIHPLRGSSIFTTSEKSSMSSHPKLGWVLPCNSSSFQWAFN